MINHFCHHREIKVWMSGYQLLAEQAINNYNRTPRGRWGCASLSIYNFYNNRHNVYDGMKLELASIYKF